MTVVERLLLQATTLKHMLGHILVSPKGLFFLLIELIQFMLTFRILICTYI